VGLSFSQRGVKRKKGRASLALEKTLFILEERRAILLLEKEVMRKNQREA